LNLIRHLERQREWSARTFGEGRRVEGLCRHIELELAEVRGSDGRLDEWLDVVTLALDGAWRSGASSAQVAAALVDLQARNMARKWGKVRGEDEACEHVREGAQR
jgi:hypothetical protein